MKSHAVGLSSGNRRAARRGFSLVELIVVLAVTVMLTSLLFPAFRGVRESAQRLACASNMRQIGLALTMYSDQHNGLLPRSLFSNYSVSSGQVTGPRELMSATLGEYATHFQVEPGASSWAGLGWLLPNTPGGGFLDTGSVLFSPSYRGAHTYDRYAAPLEGIVQPGSRLITNYHYCGHSYFDRADVRRLTNSHDQVLLAGGLWAVREMNQRNGTNVLRGDCAVTWFNDEERELRSLVEQVETTSAASHPSTYSEMWDLLVRVR